MSERAGALLVTRNFPPLRGGMERLNQRLLAALGGCGQVALVGPAGASRFAPAQADVLEVPASPLWRFFAAVFPAAIRMARRHRPAIVVAGSGLTAPFAWIAARLCGARSVVYLHGLDLVVPNRVYRMLWLPLIRRCDVAIANSRNTARLAIERGVAPGRLHVVNPGTDLPRLEPGAGQRFREQHGLLGRQVMLSVGRLTRRKGLRHFVGAVLPRVLERHPGAVLLVIGADADDALTADGSSEHASILARARAAGVEPAIRWLPPCDDATLSVAYQASDVHVFPVVDIPGDVEGFGMVAVEAAAHGLPTVAHAVGGVPDAVADGRSGTLVPPEDAKAFAEAVLHWLQVGGSARDACRAHGAAFGWDRFEAGVRSALSVDRG